MAWRTGELKYNKSNQAYMVIGNFSLKSNTGIDNYVRVKFTTTGHEQIVKEDLEDLGQFEDESLFLQDEHKEVESFKIATLDTIITAIAPNNKEYDVHSGELEDFSIDHKLDFNAVQSVVSGQQKTHRRWQFVKKS